MKNEERRIENEELRMKNWAIMLHSKFMFFIRLSSYGKMLLLLVVAKLCARMVNRSSVNVPKSL
jgi:hypothetical protein